MNIEHENLFKSALAAGVNLFIGAGFSVLAKDSEGRSLPVGNQLNQELIRTFSLRGMESLDLSQICTVLEATRSNELNRYIDRRFRVASFDERYSVLEQHNLKTIFTTNIDDLIFKIFEPSIQRYINDIDVVGPSFHERDALNYVALHGCVRNPNRKLRFGAADLAGAFGSDPDRWQYLVRRINEFPTLFWGYSVKDAGTLQALGGQDKSSFLQKDKWIVVHPSNATDGSVEFFKALGFHIIVADTRTVLDYLFTIERPVPMVIGANAIPTKLLFPNEAIPEPGNVPVRPILDFFLGSAPRWSDVYSGALFPTSYYTQLRNAIAAERHVIIAGIPACGKSTLLMRAAAESTFPGHKLILQAPTTEKAQNVISRLDGQRALVLVDDLAESMDGFMKLASAANIQLVGADRDYNFRNVQHRIDKRHFEIISVTELSLTDIEGCLKSIPEGIRIRGARRMGRSGEAWSLFEIIESNVTAPTLKVRFKEVLHQLKEQDANLRDLLLMFSYVHACRTPVSMDMIVAYMREVTTDYEDLSRMCERLGELVREYQGNMAETSQDHFMPRSTLVADSVIANATTADLKELLLRFHQEVSPYRICRYDIFKKHAYDADITHRAFGNWEEGLNFYEGLFARDNSAGMLQQCALYLSRKGRDSEAFRMIDRALIKSSGRSPNIRNSHAVILFEANIKFAGDATADAELKQSMNILTECYESDKRTVYHAMRFANQAIRLHNALGSEEAEEYLKTALKWMQVECKKAPWDRDARRALGGIERLVTN